MLLLPLRAGMDGEARVDVLLGEEDEEASHDDAEDDRPEDAIHERMIRWYDSLLDGSADEHGCCEAFGDETVKGECFLALRMQREVDDDWSYGIEAEGKHCCECEFEHARLDEEDAEVDEEECFDEEAELVVHVHPAEDAAGEGFLLEEADSCFSIAEDDAEGEDGYRAARVNILALHDPGEEEHNSDGEHATLREARIFLQ